MENTKHLARKFLLSYRFVVLDAGWMDILKSVTYFSCFHHSVWRAGWVEILRMFMWWNRC